MAQLSGDGPNRGKSAPSPRRLPKPVDDGPRAETRREGTRRPAQQAPLPAVKAARQNRTPRFTYPILGGLFGKDKAGYDLPEKKKKIDLGLEKKKVDLAPERQDYETVMKDVWGNLDNEGAAGMIKRSEGGSTLDPAQQRAQIVQNVADQYNVKARLGARDAKRIAREKADRSETDKVLTAAEWAKLSPMQQAAAQANYDLSLAVAKDFKDQGKHTANSSQKEGGTARIQDYQDRVEELFGPDGASTFKGLQFAPNTLAFLESRGIDTKEELAGKTMDDIVSGDALIDEETFAALGKPTANDSRARDVTFAKTLAQGQLNYQEKLAAQLQRGNELLNDITGRGANAAAAERYGANPIPAHAKMTAVRPEMLAQIDKYMEVLARPDIPMEESLGSIQADLSGVDKTEAAQIWENMIERSRMATTGEVQWFDDVDFEMRSPVEVAQALGAPTLKRLGAK